MNLSDYLEEDYKKELIASQAIKNVHNLLKQDEESLVNQVKEHLEDVNSFITYYYEYSQGVWTLKGHILVTMHSQEFYNLQYIHNLEGLYLGEFEANQGVLSIEFNFPGDLNSNYDLLIDTQIEELENL